MKATLLYNMILMAILTISPRALAAAPAAQPTEDPTTLPVAAAQIGSTSVTAMPLELTAIDLLTKVYGVLDTGLDEKQAIEQAESAYDLTPSADSNGLWLDSADGYVVSYYGMTPPISAVAHYDDDGVADYSYFFLFPYNPGERHAADIAQCAFCGYMLQEMHDLGLMLGVPDSADSIFETVGSYNDCRLAMRLVEEQHADNSGRFILILKVEPGAFTPADDVLAQF